MESKVLEAIRKFILEEHNVYELWYNASVPKDKKWFKLKIADEFDDDYHLVFPDGSEYKKKKLCKTIFDDYGSSNDFKIKIKKLTLKEISKDIFLARYQEWQYYDGKRQNKRITVSVLKIDKDTGRIISLHTHESPIEYTPGM
ncbi:MAG: hypothetical protein ABIF40_01930 [archaeon]